MSSPRQPSARFTPVSSRSFKARCIGWLASSLIKFWCYTLRFKVEDPDGFLTRAPGPAIWAFWHNKIFVMPAFYHRRVRPRRPTGVLTSPSGDGAILAAVMHGFGMESVRGSSNKRAAQSLVECRRRLQMGYTLGVTPDGPRGPRYQLAPGIIQLSRLTGTPIVPVCVTLHRKWELRSWDRFQIPRPFSKVTITFCPVVHCEGEIEPARLAVEQALSPE